MTPPDKRENELSDDLRGEARGMDVAVSFVVSVLLVGGLGFALDRWLGTRPWLMMAGGVVGFVAWMRMVWGMMNPPKT